MGYSPAVSSGLHFPLHGRGAHRDCTSQLLPRHCSTRHILRSSTLPLCSVNGCCICHHGRIHALIPTIFRIHPSQHLNKNPFWGYVRRGKSNFLPTTLPRASRNATTVLGLPRCLYPLKHGVFNWITNLFSSSNYVLIYSLRSICRQTGSIISRAYHNKRRMTTRLPTSLPHLRGAGFRASTSKITRKGGIEPP